MQFSFWPHPAKTYSEALELCRHVEQTGWDGFWYSDHFMPDADNTDVPWPEAWTTLSALGASVPRIRIGTLVTANTYRHPAVLAKMVATLDHITGGRVVFGLGGGWQENEHRQYGIVFGTVNERLQRLEESCQVIKALFAPGKASFDGRYFQLNNASFEPKPLQQPLPLLIGGGGEKVTLKIVAKYANEWNVLGDPGVLRRKMEILDGYCAEIGRDPSEIQRSAVAMLYMSEDPAFLERMRNANLKRPAIIGTPEEVREIVDDYARAGVNELVVPDFTMGNCKVEKLATMDKFINEIAQR